MPDYEFLLSLNKVYLLVILLAMAADISIGLWQLKLTRTFVKNSAKAVAEVLSAHFTGRDKYRYFEISLKFKNEDGKEVFAKILKYYRKYRKGKKVEILYLKHDETNIKINSKISLYLLPFIFLFLTPLTVATVSVITYFVVK